MKLDLHVHSSYSPDGSHTPKEIIDRAKKNGLDGVAVMDHNQVKGSLEAYDIAKFIKDFTVIRGAEISSKDGHILAFGITENVERDLPVAETVERIAALGGIAVVSHPYRFWSGAGPKVFEKAKFSGVEVKNARSSRSGNLKAEKLAEKYELGRTGGSDAHHLDDIGKAVTVFEIDSSNEEELIREIVRRRTRAEGQDRTLGEALPYASKCVSEWIGRGFKRM